MKIAISLSSNSLDSQIATRFGRAPYFMIYETEDDTYEIKENRQDINAPSGAGIQASQNIADTGAEVLLTSNCGPKAFAALRAANIKVVTGAIGKAQDVIDRFKKGEYAYAKGGNVGGHW